MSKSAPDSQADPVIDRLDGAVATLINRRKPLQIMAGALVAFCMGVVALVSYPANAESPAAIVIYALAAGMGGAFLAVSILKKQLDELQTSVINPVLADLVGLKHTTDPYPSLARLKFVLSHGLLPERDEHLADSFSGKVGEAPFHLDFLSITEQQGKNIRRVVFDGYLLTFDRPRDLPEGMIRRCRSTYSNTHVHMFGKKGPFSHRLETRFIYPLADDFEVLCGEADADNDVFERLSGPVRQTISFLPSEARFTGAVLSGDSITLAIESQQDALGVFAMWESRVQLLNALQTIAGSFAQPLELIKIWRTPNAE